MNYIEHGEQLSNSLVELMCKTAERMKNTDLIIRGALSPCSVCIGCELEDGRMGKCEGFIYKEDK